MRVSVSVRSRYGHRSMGHVQSLKTPPLTFHSAATKWVKIQNSGIASTRSQHTTKPLSTYPERGCHEEPWGSGAVRRLQEHSGWPPRTAVPVRRSLPMPPKLLRLSRS
ncbi:hypothetical protein E2C01_040923 [Portunus trituberculatus]|uniref:Uncharacterized protein n=1 Tax=Portunus trituberculatus TaxID=210409 RepID=A0A5B7FP08_PORTR|nr:hypothetical protein [Portunus trituberculatus]